MNIRLVDFDSKIPNLALMQLSTYHKSLGDNVGFDITNPDKIYVSCIFQKNRSLALGLKTMYPDTDMVFGGTGIDLHTEIPKQAQTMTPDYSLYPNIPYSIGMTTKGCIRKCPFCVVPEKEGRITKHMHVSQFYNPKFKKIWFLDNNMYALKDWFMENTDFVIDHNLTMKAVCGFDIRILTDEIAEQLSKIRFEHQTITFAFDNMQDEQKVRDGIECLVNHGIKPYNLNFYVLTGFNTTFDEDMYRVNLLREKGCLSFVMQFKPSQETRMLARYTNRRWVYRSIPFAEYKPFIEYQKKHVVGDLTA